MERKLAFGSTFASIEGARKASVMTTRKQLQGLVIIWKNHRYLARSWDLWQNGNTKKIIPPSAENWNRRSQNCVSSKFCLRSIEISSGTVNKGEKKRPEKMRPIPIGSVSSGMEHRRTKGRIGSADTRCKHDPHVRWKVKSDLGKHVRVAQMVNRLCFPQFNDATFFDWSSKTRREIKRTLCQTIGELFTQMAFDSSFINEKVMVKKLRLKRIILDR
jgi:hypothetical protein